MSQEPDGHKSLAIKCSQSPKIIVALGSNLPFGERSPVDLLRAALSAINDSLLKVEQVSGFYATPSFPEGSGPDYVNAAALLCGELSAGEILQILHRIEADYGRTRETRWGQRTLDLDLLAVGDAVLPDVESYAYLRDLAQTEQIGRAPKQLVLPHPRIQDRAFVLVPLAEIAPDWCHPVSGQTATQMLAALPKAEISSIRPL